MLNNLTPEEVARRFRMWRIAKRSTASVGDLAEETRVPAKWIQKILSAGVAPDFTTHLSEFLLAHERGDVQSLAELHAGRSNSVLPPPHETASYEPFAVDALKAHQRRLVDINARPYCLVARQKISARHCIMSQNCRDCYGCAAETRFCVECNYAVVAFGGTELCAYCLTQRLQDPDTDRLRHVWITHVDCQQANNRAISVTTCQRTQGDGCGNCAAISRVCTSCKNKRVRYPDFGLCLGCHTQLLGFGWEPLAPEVFEEQTAERKSFFRRAHASEERSAARVITILAEPEFEPERDPESVKKAESTALAVVPTTEVGLAVIETPIVEWPPTLLHEQKKGRTYFVRVMELLVLRSYGTYEQIRDCLHIAPGSYEDYHLDYLLRIMQTIGVTAGPGRTRIVGTLKELYTLYYYCYASLGADASLCSLIMQRCIGQYMLETKKTSMIAIRERFNYTALVREAYERLVCKGIIGPAKRGPLQRPLLVESILELDEKLRVAHLGPQTAADREKVRVLDLRCEIRRVNALRDEQPPISRLDMLMCRALGAHDKLNHDVHKLMALVTRGVRKNNP